MGVKASTPKQIERALLKASQWYEKSGKLSEESLVAEYHSARIILDLHKEAKWSRETFAGGSVKEQAAEALGVNKKTIDRLCGFAGAVSGEAEVRRISALGRKHDLDITKTHMSHIASLRRATGKTAVSIARGLLKEGCTSTRAWEERAKEMLIELNTEDPVELQLARQFLQRMQKAVRALNSLVDNKGGRLQLSFAVLSKCLAGEYGLLESDKADVIRKEIELAKDYLSWLGSQLEEEK